ncbi:MAG: hypothetical protein LPJ95_09375, partial [Paracoccaceae bacterium]|nr:hypothetical protein [Paracoccaceae bacterium]
ARVSYLQLLVAALMFVGYFVFCHLQVVGFGIVFTTITGVPYEYAVFAFLAILLLTSLGGFWSVAATDTLNAVLILIGLASAPGRSCRPPAASARSWTRSPPPPRLLTRAASRWSPASF